AFGDHLHGSERPISENTNRDLLAGNIGLEQNPRIIAKGFSQAAVEGLYRSHNADPDTRSFSTGLDDDWIRQSEIPGPVFFYHLPRRSRQTERLPHTFRHGLVHRQCAG